MEASLSAAKLSTAGIHLLEEANQSLEVDLGIIELGKVAAIGAVVITTLLHLSGHPFHVLGIHRVVGGTDGEGGHADLA